MPWRDIDLANGRFEVGRDKTDAGMREVDMVPLMREILTEHKAASRKTGPDDPVFQISTGTARSRHNLRQGSSGHHTFASILVAIGKDPTDVMQQLGHTDPAFTLRVYSHMMRALPFPQSLGYCGDCRGLGSEIGLLPSTAGDRTSSPGRSFSVTANCDARRVGRRGSAHEFCRGLSSLLGASAGIDCLLAMLSHVLRMALPLQHGGQAVMGQRFSFVRNRSAPVAGDRPLVRGRGRP